MRLLAVSDFTLIAGRIAEALRQEKPPVEELGYRWRYQQWEQDCISVGAALAKLENDGPYSIHTVNEFIHACGSTKTL